MEVEMKGVRSMHAGHAYKALIRENLKETGIDGKVILTF
jgi:hypothetical protein